MPCACENGNVNGDALGQFSPSAVQILTESADPNTKIFPWSMPARFYQKPNRMVIYGTCLVAGTTRKGDTFSKDELERHGCTLIHGPIEAYNHSWDDGGNHWLSYPENVILDAEEVNGELQYIAGIDDKPIQEAISKKEITSVSVNTICRRVPADNPGVCQGMILNGFCLLGKDSTPASPGTNVKIWNCLRATVPLRLGGGGQCTCKTEKVDEKTSQENDKKTFDEFRNFVTNEIGSINAKLDSIIKTNSPSAAAPPAAPAQNTVAQSEHADSPVESDVCNIEPSMKTQQVNASPVAATVPVDKLPVATVNVKVEEIEAIVQDRALFTPMLKLNAILDLCERKRLEVV